ncbi:MAG: 30S ribosome-binding factor RbfA [Desulfobacteraceae bacterium]
MKPYSRAERIGVKIQTVLSELMIKKISDPRVEMATISRVVLTGDLSIAYVYYSVFGEAEAVDNAAEGFQSCKKFIKKQIAPELKLKYMPDLQFVHDDSFDYGAKIDTILKSVSDDSPDEI